MCGCVYHLRLNILPTTHLPTLTLLYVWSPPAGPTEATIISTNLKCWPNMPGMTIGFPEANMHCYIVDRNMQPVPPGVPGELLLSGPRLARGYVGRDDLTADKFIPNPCLEDVEELLPQSLRQYFRLAYRTGGSVACVCGHLDCAELRV